MPNLFPPLVTTIPTNVQVGSRVSLASMFTVADLDPNTVYTKFLFRDNSTYAPGGYFVLNGVRQQSGTWIEISAANLANVYYQSGLIVSNETFGVQAFDGVHWSNAAFGDVNSVVANVRKPIVVGTPSEVVGYEGRTVSSLFTASDPDGYPITKFMFVDRSWNGTGGFFSLDGVRQTSAVWFEINASQLSKLRYIGGQVGESENVGIRAFDGALWSDATDIVMTTIANVAAPVVEAFDLDMPINTKVLASSLFKFVDGDANTIKKVQFFDTGTLGTGGFFTVDGIVQPSNTWFEVSSDQLSNTFYHTASQSDSERFRVRAFDGRFWSTNTSAKIISVSKPVFSGAPKVISVDENSLTEFDMIAVPDSGPAISQFEVIDLNDHQNSARLLVGTPSTGTFLDPLEIHSLTATQFDNLQIYGGNSTDPGRTFDPIVFRAFNGFFWSEWQRLDVNTDVGASVALDFGADWDTGPGTQILTYTFLTAIPGYYSDESDEYNGSPEVLSPIQIAKVREALALYESLLDIRFVEIPQTQGIGQFTFMQFQEPDTSVLGHAYLPSGPGLPGDVWLDSDSPNIINMDAEGYLTVLHELGHALGLKHPFDPNDPPTNPNVLPPGADQTRLTMMSYTRSGPDVLTPMLYDLAELQKDYGPNFTYNADDTQIFLPEDFNSFQIIWDGGGIDALNFGNQNSSVVADLRPGYYMSIGNTVDHIVIAYGVDIENLRGGRGDDTLRGNALNNVIIGGIGNDMLQGFAGVDTMMGGEHNDTYLYTFGDGFDIIDEDRKAGRDTLVLNAFGEFNSFQQDLKFRLANNGLDLDIQLTVNGSASQGGITIRNMAWGGSRIETLRILDVDGEEINPDVDMRSLFAYATNELKSFRLTEFQGTYGVLAVPV